MTHVVPKRMLEVCIVGLAITIAGCGDGDVDKLPAASVFSDRKVAELVTAAEKGDVATVEKLARDGVDVNAKGKQDVTPLFRCFVARNKEGYAALLRHGASPNNLDSRGRAVMNQASYDEESYWLREALKHGGDPNLPNDGRSRLPGGRTPIFYTISDKRVTNAKLLIDAGADVNHVDQAGAHPLRQAAQESAYSIVFLLVESGADIRKKDGGGDDLVSWISRRNEDYVVDPDEKVWFRKTVELLRSKGVKITLYGEEKEAT